MITVEDAGEDVRVTIPKRAVSREQVNTFLNWLRLEEIAQGSRLAETEADRLAEAAKENWWRMNKDRFVPPSER